MGTTLTGTTIAAGYDSLLKTTDNGPIDSSLKIITDGLGNDSSVKLSNSNFQVTRITFDGTTNLKFTRISIGDWDMDLLATITVAHGLTGAVENVVMAQVFIINDTGTSVGPLDTGSGAGNPPNGYYSIDATNFNLTRIGAGLFDSTSYDSTSYNRGYINVWYVG